MTSRSLTASNNVKSFNIFVVAACLQARSQTYWSNALFEGLMCLVILFVALIQSDALQTVHCPRHPPKLFSLRLVFILYWHVSVFKWITGPLANFLETYSQFIKIRNAETKGQWYKHQDSWISRDCSMSVNRIRHFDVTGSARNDKSESISNNDFRWRYWRCSFAF